jgi:glycosyltransferase involved in cell wall biosynthesis
MQISVIIPTHNRAARLQGCLHALVSQTIAPSSFEVVVVDDGSDRPLDETIRPFATQLQITLIRQTNGGPARARNTGARHARGVLLAFTDDDCAPDPTWLAVYQRCFETNPNAAFGGRTVNALPENSYSAASQLLVDYLYDYFGTGRGQQPENASAPFFTSNNFALAATAFRDAGGFDETFPLAAGEDREFCDRWQQQGRTLTYVADATIQHAHQLTWRRFLRQHHNYGRGAFHLRRARRRRGLPEQRLEPVGFYMGLVLFPRRRHEAHAQRLMALMFLTQVANALGFWQEAARSRRDHGLGRRKL